MTNIEQQELAALRAAERSLEGINFHVHGEIQALFDRISLVFNHCEWSAGNSIQILEEYVIDAPYDTVRVMAGKDGSGLERIQMMVSLPSCPPLTPLLSLSRPPLPLPALTWDAVARRAEEAEPVAEPAADPTGPLLDPHRTLVFSALCSVTSNPQPTTNLPSCSPPQLPARMRSPEFPFIQSSHQPPTVCHLILVLEVKPPLGIGSTTQLLGE